MPSERAIRMYEGGGDSSVEDRPINAEDPVLPGAKIICSQVKRHLVLADSYWDGMAGARTGCGHAFGRLWDAAEEGSKGCCHQGC